MSPIEAKIRVVQELDTPWDVKDVRSFLRFANYYRRYIHQFAEVAHLLTELTKRVWIGNGGRVKRRHSAS